MQQWKNKKLKSLAQALIHIDNEKDMLAFLRDVATIEELNDLSTRWQAAKLIHEGIPYRKISEKTGLSTTTVTRIAFWVNHGEGGYKNLLEK
jgi:TrpR-related protein YerC/YecD